MSSCAYVFTRGAACRLHFALEIVGGATEYDGPAEIFLSFSHNIFSDEISMIHTFIFRAVKFLFFCALYTGRLKHLRTLATNTSNTENLI